MDTASGFGSQRPRSTLEAIDSEYAGASHREDLEMTDRAFRVTVLGLPALVLLLVAGFLLFSQVSASGDETLVRFQMFGPGSTFNAVYELTTDGVLRTSRYSLSGELLERRDLSLDASDKGRVEDLLREAGYLTADPSDLRRPEVQAQLNAVMDLPHWKIEVHRAGSDVVQIEVPDKYVGEFHPELREVPYVRVAWELLAEFEASWNRSEKVEP